MDMLLYFWDAWMYFILTTFGPKILGVDLERMFRTRSTSERII